MAAGSPPRGRASGSAETGSATAPRITAVRASLLTFDGNPFAADMAAARRYEGDAIVAMADNRILDCGPAREVLPRLPPGTAIEHYEHALVTPGFVDAHVHYAQLPIIGAGGKPLLDWLAAYTFPAERRYADIEFARSVAARYFDENLRNGITTAAVFGTVHPQSVDALFEEASRRGLRTICGKVLMDRHAPADLLDTAQAGYDASKALLERWHGQGRLAYAVTPRFAATSSPEQLEVAAALWREADGAYLQSHVAENRDEVRWVGSLFPDRSSYVDVYAHFGLLGPRSIYAHAIHLHDADLADVAQSGAAIAHCPTSNNFLGSGQFGLHHVLGMGVPVALGTDLGAGTSFSMFRTMQAAADIAHLQGRPLPASCAWWLATAGGAAALDLGERVGRIAPGYEADLVVVDLRATPLIDFRMRYVDDIDEALAVLLALGDDRAIRATYVEGRLAYDRDVPL